MEERLDTVFNNLRAGGFSGGDDDDKCKTAAIGTKAPVVYVLADVPYYLTKKHVKLARRPCLAGKDSVFGYLRGPPNEAHAALFARAVKHNHLIKRITKLIDAIKSIERALVVCVIELARKGRPLNISLPTLNIDGPPRNHSAEDIEHVTNSIVDYLNRLDVNSIIARPARPNLGRLAPVAAALPDAPPAGDLGPEGLAEYELKLGGYSAAVEEYHCDALGVVENALGHCKKIRAGFGSP